LPKAVKSLMRRRIESARLLEKKAATAAKIAGNKAKREAEATAIAERKAIRLANKEAKELALPIKRAARNA